MFRPTSRLSLALGAIAVSALSIVGANVTGPALAEDLAQKAAAKIAETGGAGHVVAQFDTANGFASRHPVLVGGEGLNDSTRARVARAVGAISGVGGVRWAESGLLAAGEMPIVNPLHCQDDVNGLLRARTIRFEGGSARIDAASNSLVDEVAAALRPCLGSIIAITGHTDNSGSAVGNLALSRERAAAVEAALVARGIPSDGLRARGVGSQFPVEGLEPGDPANRRIEFAVIATEPVLPTPVDTPGPR
ncbi:OmpA family protein [Altererythrobacter sp. KTW20L]|uniref:OmpA family protein n=1 Tax=Altererythrobacter sp. KTW20L TaxID=2942210 RepID=UPI0020BD7E99|nr:OmpA family protein [Altererythrobacter sp. KTW20L]MCL6249652.1 OmpA family protein [Altererythrobacter sp. KTW20L]